MIALCQYEPYELKGLPSRCTLVFVYFFDSIPNMKTTSVWTGDVIMPVHFTSEVLKNNGATNGGFLCPQTVTHGIGIRILKRTL